MSAWARIKLLLGAVTIVGLVAALTMHMNKQMSTVHDVTATLRSQEYTVGTDYSGVLARQFVQAGDHVEAGQPIAVVKSNLLGRDITNGLVAPETSPYEIRGNNTLVLRATSPGTITAAPFIKGAFIPENTQLAHVQVQDTTFVDAQFRLSAQEYAQIRNADRVTVTLPNKDQVTATISAVSVRTTGGRAQTRVTATAPRLADDSLFTAGTPVDVRVQLPRDGLVTSLTDAATGLLTPASDR